MLGVPLMRGGVPIGVFGLSRKEMRPFTEKQVELLATFADQAVIAIENARLLNELRQRTDDLTESLEQQTATGEILSSMSGSIADTKPVFDAIVRNLLRLFGTRFATIQLLQDGMIHLPAVAGEPGFERLADLFPRPLNDESFSGQAMLRKEPFQLSPLVDNPAVPYFGQQNAREFGYNSIIFAPMIRGDEVIGAIGTARREAKPFSEQQVALLKAFADQAVIAIENARLLNELRVSLEQQTATSQVLSVISSSPGELGPVFRAMLANAVRICEAKFGNLYLHEGGGLRMVAEHDVPPMFAKARRDRVVHPAPDSALSGVIGTKQTTHIPDLMATRSYEERHVSTVEAVEVGGVRTVVAVPLLKEDELVGIIAIYRQEVHPFTDKQVALLTNFAAQAVIAIENTRLLNELRESLQQQTATADVLKVISSSPGELEPVFEAMLENATRICEADFGNLLLRENDAFRIVALHGAPRPYLEERQRNPIVRPSPGSDLDRLVNTKEIVHVPDLRMDKTAKSMEITKLAGARTLLSVPMLRDDLVVGALGIYRQEVRPFTEKQIDLVRNFAAQAVIAIENTRLLNELRQRTTDLTESLEQQTATSEVLSVISSSPGELEPVFQAMLANATRLCEANFGLLHLRESGAFRVGAIHNVPAAFAQAVALRGPLLQPGPAHPLARMAAAKQLIHVFDCAEDPAYRQREPAAVRLVELAGARSVIAVPMLNDDELVGAITIFRQEVRPFTDKQIALVQNFAAQAVIAIENTRLLNELRRVTRTANGNLSSAERYLKLPGRA